MNPAPLPAPARKRAASVNMAFQAASVGLTMVQGFVLVPLYLRHIGLEVYGAWLAMSGALAWLALLDPGVSSVFEQRVAQTYGQGDRTRLQEVIGTGFLLNVSIQGALAAAALLAAPFLPRVVNAPSAQAQSLTAAFCLAAVAEGVLGVALTNATIAIALLAYPVTLGTIYLLSTALGIAVTVALLLGGWGVLSIPLGLLARAAALLAGNSVLLAVLCGLRLRLRPACRLAEARAIAGLTGYSWAGRAGEALTNQADAFLTSVFLGPAAVPVLTVTRNACDVIAQLTGRIGVALTPGLAHLKGEGDESRLAEVALRLMRIALWVAALGMGGYLALNRAFVSLWVGPEVYGGPALTALYAALLLWLGAGRVLSRCLFAVGLIPEVSLAGLAEACLRAAALAALYRAGSGLAAVPLAGLLGAASVSLWYLPRLFATKLPLPPAGGPQLLRGAASAAAALATLALIWQNVLSAPGHWVGFAAQAAAFLMSGVLILALIDPQARAELRAAREFFSLRMPSPRAAAP